MKLFFVLSLVVSTACAFSVSSFSSRFSTRLHPTFASVQEAIADAQRICAINPASPECRVAWDIVEELEAADSHRGGMKSSAQTDNSAFLGGFKILTQKIDGKMDQLKATSEMLVQLGVTDPSVAELAIRAEEMKQQLAKVRALLGQ
jgi:hypothetical protein